jgi:hypothetical protein
MGLTAPPSPPPIVKEQRNSQIKKFLKNIGIRATSASGIRATAATGRMTVRVDLGVASILIPKTVQNGIRGCFISHPQKNSSKLIRGLLHFSSPKVFIYKISAAENSNKFQKIRFWKENQLKTWYHLGQRHRPQW